MQSSMMVGMGLMSLLLVAGNGLALTDALADEMAFAQGSADAALGFGQQAYWDAAYKAGLVSGLATTMTGNVAGQANAAAVLGQSVAQNQLAAAQAIAALELAAIGATGQPDCTVNLVDGFSGIQHGIAMLCQGAHEDLGAPL